MVLKGVQLEIKRTLRLVHGYHNEVISLSNGNLQGKIINMAKSFSKNLLDLYLEITLQKYQIKNA